MEEKEAIQSLKDRNFEDFGYTLDKSKEYVIKIRIENASDLIEFPEELLAFKKLEHITIRNCNVAAIPEFIVEFSNLQQLELKGNPIKEIPEYITQCRKLYLLDIQNTEISILPEYLTKLPLQGIRLKGSKINGFPSILYEFDSLKALTLSELKELPSDIGKIKLEILYASLKSFKYLDDLENLNILDLKNSTAKYLPENFGNLQKLEHLNLENCKNLVKLPHSIGNIKMFWGITLSGCSRLTALPSSMNKVHIGALDLDLCYNLRSVPKGMMVGAITARETKWKSIPSGIFYSTCHNLDVTDHQITDITGIGNMYNLNILNLSRGNIKKIPDDIGRLKELSMLIIEHNDIKVIPRVLDNCPKLKSVRLYGNPVYDMKELEVLN
ncbi:hypothetical protein KMW28_26855 [Flammeovirga yaeyamensis]|uniref:Uncharacterized protein n=1 Tax=Flammeovirga yaeyamensis TaxID=367791 RepID=A0AAX1NDT0_9BACT|nr:hypothetical protein [Flammeovirga yaeyamensis]MBB3701540.1 Leucine-rich repeat (LRR) protein [Flammeovirga yaeyamensis]NMF38684.1 hypothetical protein [Flammeovirga yaeyamensis]QWG04520.1 hypothetical protein KMW28_26855 [Flammeovirga yaeyamensis]